MYYLEKKIQWTSLETESTTFLLLYEIPNWCLCPYVYMLFSLCSWNFVKTTIKKRMCFAKLTIESPWSAKCAKKPFNVTELLTSKRNKDKHCLSTPCVFVYLLCSPKILSNCYYLRGIAAPAFVLGDKRNTKNFILHIITIQSLKRFAFLLKSVCTTRYLEFHNVYLSTGAFCTKLSTYGQ